MKNNKKQRRLFILAIVAGIIVGIGIFSVEKFYPTDFELIDTNPESNTIVSDFEPTITLTFSKELSAFDPQIDLEIRPFIDAVVETSGNELSIKPRHELLENTEYWLFFQNIVSKEGEAIDQITFTFTTGQDESPRANFIRSLPIYESGFTINYTRRSDTFVVEITAEPVEENEQRARKFIENSPLDSSDRVIYEVNRTLQGSGSPAG